MMGTTIRNESIPLGKEKRPARLLPNHILNPHRKSTEAPVLVPTTVDYYWPSHLSNCQDLTNIGYTLNGFCLVSNKNRNKLNISTKILAIYCDFKNPQLLSSDRETEIGYLDVKTIHEGVHLKPTKAALRPTLGLGGAFDSASGVFTSPKSGVYQFAFKAFKDPHNPDYLIVFLRLNGVKQSVTFSSDGKSVYPVSLHWALKLKKGDQVDLFKTTSKLFCNDMEPSSYYFTGSLLIGRRFKYLRKGLGCLNININWLYIKGSF